MLTTIRQAIPADAPAVAGLLTAYMAETFDRPWLATVDDLLRDGFGAAFELVVASRGDLVGFAAYRGAYDLHHCLPGGEVIDMYVAPRARGHGVAPAMLARVAALVRDRGGRYLTGHEVGGPATQALYRRLAMRFPGAACIVGGRAFRALADLDGADGRTLARSLPDPAWNLEK